LFTNSVLAKQQQESLQTSTEYISSQKGKLTMTNNIHGIYRYVKFVDPDTGLEMFATAHRRGKPSQKSLNRGDIVCMGAVTHAKFIVKLIRVNLQSASGIVVQYYDEDRIGDVINRPFREIWKTESGPVVDPAGIQHQVEVQVQAILAPPLALLPPEDAADPQDALEVIAVLPEIADAPQDAIANQMAAAVAPPAIAATNQGPVVPAAAAANVPRRRPNNRPLQRQVWVRPPSPCPICKRVPQSNKCILRMFNTTLLQCSVFLVEQEEFLSDMGIPHAIVDCGHSFCAVCSAGLGYGTRDE
jgi:hypothetical protein